MPVTTLTLTSPIQPLIHNRADLMIVLSQHLLVMMICIKVPLHTFFMLNVEFKKFS